jgi:hypothetical protein
LIDYGCQVLGSKRYIIKFAHASQPLIYRNNTLF